MNTEIETDPGTREDVLSPLPLVLLTSDQPRMAAHLCRVLQKEGISVKFAPSYAELESLSHAHENAVVLIEVSHQQSVEEAVDLALRLKRRNASQFVGYLADPVLHTSGLAGDAIFPRRENHLPDALRAYFNSKA